jgi:hypothetical protein
VTLTATGAVLGSVLYMSPEQLAGGAQLTARSDVFALGVTLFECLTGRRPFSATTAQALRHEQLTHAPPEPRRLDASVPIALQWVCMRAMAPEPARRYPSAAAMAADLEAFVRGEPIQAGPPTLRTRLRRLVRRHRRLSLAVLMLVAAAVLVLGPYSMLARDVEAAQRELALARLADARLFGDERRVDALLPELIAAHPTDLPLRMLAALHDIQRGCVAAADQHLVAARRIRGADATLLDQATVALHLLRATSPGAAAQADVAALTDPPEEDAVGCWLRGEILRLLQRFDACVRLLRAARRLDPRLGAHVANSLVDALSRLGEHRQARDEVLAVAQLRGAPDAFSAVVRLDLLCGERMSATAHAADLRTRFPASAWNHYCELLLLDPAGEDPAEVEALLARAQADAGWPQIQAKALGVAADLLRRRGAPERAVEIWEGLLRDDPDNASVHGLLGSALLQRAELAHDPARREQGLAELKRAAELGDGRMFERDVHWGTYWYYAGEPERAAEHFARATEQMPGHASCWRQLAGACAAAASRAKDRAGRIDWLIRGVAAQEREIRLAPGLARPWHFLVLQLRGLHHELAAADDPRALEVQARLDAAAVRLKTLER